MRFLAPFVLLVAVCACENNQKTPTPPPVPDMGSSDVGSQTDATADASATDTADTGSDAATDGFPLSPIAVNLIKFIPETLDGVPARRRQVVKTAPIVHGFYPGEKRQIINLHITGPHKTERERREMYPLLGKDEEVKSPKEEVKGLKLAGFDAQRMYQPKKQKAETVVLVNEFVEVRLSIAPTKDKEAATKLLEKEVDLVGVSKLR